ncbi:hypothetical protein B0H14DRAFT_3445327 [Mycena olivaceomarginata]|nr:hypothetical protein B0H14DRAFT_3445327 [Mycena olivaceomarginata]
MLSPPKGPTSSALIYAMLNAAATHESKTLPWPIWLYFSTSTSRYSRDLFE